MEPSSHFSRMKWEFVVRVSCSACVWIARIAMALRSSNSASNLSGPSLSGGRSTGANFFVAMFFEEDLSFATAGRASDLCVVTRTCARPLVCLLSALRASVRPLVRGVILSFVHTPAFAMPTTGDYSCHYVLS